MTVHIEIRCEDNYLTDQTIDSIAETIKKQLLSNRKPDQKNGYYQQFSTVVYPYQK